MTSERAAGTEGRTLREAASRYRAAEWAIRCNEDAIRDEAHNARVEEWRAADAALALLLGESSPFRLAAARGEPGLDVERLAQALCDTAQDHWRGWDSSMLASAGIAEPDHAEVAADILAALATATTPEPDPETATGDGTA